MEKIIYICNYYGIPIDELFAEEIPKADAQQPPPSQEEKPAIPSPKLRDAISNFLINLSPGNQTVFTAGLSLILMTLFIIISIAATKGENNQMVMKLIWMGLLLLFGIGEALTVGLTSIWFAAGALLALICALMGGSMWLQIVLFFVASTLSIAAFRPIVQKYFNSKVEPTNADRIIGREALVTERISNLRAEGAVSIGGVVWSARSTDEQEIPKGSLVRILRIEGVKVYVEQVKEDVA